MGFGNLAPGTHASKSNWMENRLPNVPGPGRAGLESPSGLEATATLVVASGSLHPWFFGNVTGFLQFPWKWVLLCPGRLGTGIRGGWWQCHGAGTVPAGMWGG